MAVPRRSKKSAKRSDRQRDPSGRTARAGTAVERGVCAAVFVTSSPEGGVRGGALVALSRGRTVIADIASGQDVAEGSVVTVRGTGGRDAYGDRPSVVA